MKLIKGINKLLYTWNSSYWVEFTLDIEHQFSYQQQDNISSDDILNIIYKLEKQGEKEK